MKFEENDSKTIHFPIDVHYWFLECVWLFVYKTLTSDVKEYGSADWNENARALRFFVC